jgi:hypothetical protein
MESLAGRTRYKVGEAIGMSGVTPRTLKAKHNEPVAPIAVHHRLAFCHPTHKVEAWEQRHRDEWKRKGQQHDTGALSA